MDKIDIERIEKKLDLVYQLLMFSAIMSGRLAMPPEHGMVDETLDLITKEWDGLDE